MSFGIYSVRRWQFILLPLLVLTFAACTGAGNEEPDQATATPAAMTVTEPADEADRTQIVNGSSDILDAESAQRTFSIVPDRSEVRFVIDEILRGQPTTVVGANNLITGGVLVDLENPGRSQISTITVDANSFITDSNQRNGAIRRFILVPSQYPTITFAPANITGLSGSVAVGDTLNFQVTGDLTILTATNPVTFDVTVNALSEDEITITGSTTITRNNFGLTIPSVPFVADVAEELVLELDLVASATDS